MSNELTTSSQKSLTNMSLKEITNLCKRDVDISSMISEYSVDNMKAFLIVYSKSQLRRIIKLTDALGKLEDSLLETTLKEGSIFQQDPLLLMRVIGVIQGSLNSALGLIQQITKDESYMKIIIDNSKTINNTLNVHSAEASLLDQDSRDKVRGLVTQILDKVTLIQKDEGIDTNVIEMNPDEEVYDEYIQQEEEDN